MLNGKVTIFLTIGLIKKILLHNMSQFAEIDYLANLKW